MYSKKKILNHYTQIYKLPYNISYLDNLNIKNKIKIIGYKQIKSNLTVIVVELENFTRLWMLPNEIQNKSNTP